MKILNFNRLWLWRQILSIDDDVQANGKVFKKFSLSSDYDWVTYAEALTRIRHLSDGLLAVGLKSNDNIVLFAETRPEWLYSALACFRVKIAVVTLYSTLGIDALAFGINQTSSSYLITSGEQLPKIQMILHNCPHLKHVLVMSDKFNQTAVSFLKHFFIDASLKIDCLKHWINYWFLLLNWGRLVALS